MTPTASTSSIADPASSTDPASSAGSASPADPACPASVDSAAGPADRPGRIRRTSGPLQLLLAVWTFSTALATALAVLTAGRPPGTGLFTVTAAARRRLDRIRDGRDAGLTTVEVAIITAVLLGLATALVAAITIVVNRNTSKIK